MTLEEYDRLMSEALGASSEQEAAMRLVAAAKERGWSLEKLLEDEAVLFILGRPGSVHACIHHFRWKAKGLGVSPTAYVRALLTPLKQAGVDL